ncbi:hypothetical protein [Leclercia adecarboxylata]|uniref:hypothetical protein n=1 Tax=Leclercia adecarboxylata TaxID=83655 RepID=UPI0013C72299|nr:hypothetical protein [Leclercia adecarboxylata]NEG94145.1 hypothetical protein [Leclercia adecarboxylata]
MTDTSEYKQRVADITRRSNSVMSFAASAQFDEHGLIKDSNARVQKMMEAARKDETFANVPDAVLSQICSAWGESIADYSRTFGRAPRAEVLANAHQLLENVLVQTVGNGKPRMAGIEKSMLESVGMGSDAMSSQDGIMHQAIFMAMILPTSLGAATSDACTFIPVPRDQSKIYEIINVAGTTFGDYTTGDKLDMQSVGEYAQFRRRYIVEASADGNTKTFAFAVKNHEGQDVPIRKGRSNIYISRRKSPQDNGEGTLLHTFVNKSGATVTATCTVNYNTGALQLNFSENLDAGTELAVEVELNVEAKPDIIPIINQEMKEYTLFPSQYAIAAEHSVQAAYDAQREFGIDLGQLQFSTLKNYLSHEQDMLRLRIMSWRCIHTDQFDIALPEDMSFDVWGTIFKGKMLQVMRDITERTKSTSTFGIYAGSDAANFLKQLPPGMFSLVANYSQAPYVHFVGTLFGNIKVFEIPAGVCAALNKVGSSFDPYDMLCYGRDENPGKAGFVSGDAVPAVPFVHPTTPGLKNRNTLWGSAINDMHPRNGEDYFTRLKLTVSKEGGIDFKSGKRIQAEQPSS